MNQKSSRKGNRFCLLVLLLLVLSQLSFAEEYDSNRYRTCTFTDDIQTLQLYLNDNQLDYPVMELGTSDYITVSFDFMSMQYPHLAYRVKMCRADWSASTMDELEYLKGINDVVIEDPEPSMNTTFDYSHYVFKIPNENITPILSGNYVVEVYNTEKPEMTLASGCFSVEDSRVSFESMVSGKSVYGVNTKYQHLSFEIFPNENFSPLTDELTVVVRQNGRHDNEVFDLKPTYEKPTSFVYEDERKLSFEGGKEYNVLDFSHRYRYSGKIERIAYHQPYYHVDVLPGSHEVGVNYVFDYDVDGRFKVHGQDVWSESEIDYSIVHFTYPAEEPWLDGSLYVMGGFNDNWLSERNKMVYNFDRKQYELALLLKNGGYNFLYAFLPVDWSDGAMIERAEGSHWETENTYQIFVYYRQLGSSYDQDQLVGYYEFTSK